MGSRQWHPLRIVTQRIASTPPSHLHQIAPALAETLRACTADDFTPRAKPGRDERDAAVLGHKFRTQLSSLLQEKAREARWAAVVLIKATLERGGQDVLESSGPWARGILGLLTKPEPVATKRLALLTLTRIFVLTQGQQTLAREITTPLLPGFINACISNITLKGTAQGSPKLDAAAPLLQTILQAIVKLLPHHPASFRPFAGKLKALLAPILAPTPSHESKHAAQKKPEDIPPEQTTALAQRLYALLPTCAPRNTSGEEWSKSLDTVLSNIHETADHVFRAVRETGVTRGSSSSKSVSYDGTLSHCVEDSLALPRWRGIYAGCERLVSLLQLTQAYVASASASEINIPIGSLFHTLNRILSVVEIRSRGQESDMINSEVSRDEREGLWSCLPAIHAAAVDTIWTVSERLGITAMSVAATILEQLMWVFALEQQDLGLRRSTYRVVDQIVRLIGPSMSKDQVALLGPVLQHACKDILPSNRPVPSTAAGPNGTKTSKTDNVDSYLNRSCDGPLNSEDSQSAAPEAKVLVRLALASLPSEHIPKPLRRDLDRTAVLSQDHNALAASVLNPPLGTSQAPAASLLPFLARAYPGALETEALLRPRLPFFRATVFVEDFATEEPGQPAFSPNQSGFSGTRVESELEVPQEGVDGLYRGSDWHAAPAVGEAFGVSPTSKRKLFDESPATSSSSWRSNKRRRSRSGDEGKAQAEFKWAENILADKFGLHKEDLQSIATTTNVRDKVMEASDPIYMDDDHQKLANKQKDVARTKEDASVAVRGGDVTDAALSAVDKVAEAVGLGASDDDDSSGSDIPEINLEMSSDEGMEDGGSENGDEEDRMGAG